MFTKPCIYGTGTLPVDLVSIVNYSNLQSYIEARTESHAYLQLFHLIICSTNDQKTIPEKHFITIYSIPRNRFDRKVTQFLFLPRRSLSFGKLLRANYKLSGKLSHPEDSGDSTPVVISDWCCLFLRLIGARKPTKNPNTHRPDRKKYRLAHVPTIMDDGGANGQRWECENMGKSWLSSKHSPNVTIKPSVCWVQFWGYGGAMN